MDRTNRQRIRIPLLIVVLALLLLARSARASAAIDFKALYAAAGKNIYQLETDGGIVSSCDLLGNRLVTVTLDDRETDHARLTLYDLATGKTTGERTLNGGAAVTAGLLPDGKIYTVDSMTMEATVYDSSLSAVSHMPAMEENKYASPYMTDDGGILWCADSLGNSATGFFMKDGSIRRHECGFDKELYFAGFLGFADGRLDYLLSNGSGALYLHSLYTADMTTTLTPLPQGYSYLSGDLLYAMTGDKAVFTRLGTEEVLTMDTPREDDYPMAYRSGLLAMRDMTNPLIRLYDLDSNAYRGMFSPPGQAEGIYYDKLMFSDGGYAVISAIDGDSGASALYLWNFSETKAESAGIKSMTSAEFHQEAEAQARTLGQKYGISILIYEEGAAFYDTVYKGEVISNDPSTLRALNIVEGFLSKWPEGMMREMCVDPVTHINLYLCGTIRRKNDEGILSAAAFTSTSGDVRYVVANLQDTMSLERNLAHEFMHVMEDRIYASGYEKGLDMAGYWLSMTPDGNGGAYAYSYKDANGNELTDTMYTGYDAAAENPDSVWFYDPYSKSYPIEDRARIFEYLFSSEGALPGTFAGVHMAEKAQSLCAMIRESFASAANAETLWWERLLTPMPMEKYREKVESYTAVPSGLLLEEALRHYTGHAAISGTGAAIPCSS
jgi:hypothetical protein